MRKTFTFERAGMALIVSAIAIPTLTVLYFLVFEIPKIKDPRQFQEDSSRAEKIQSLLLDEAERATVIAEGHPLPETAVQNLMFGFDLSYKLAYYNNGQQTKINESIQNLDILKIDALTIKNFLNIDSKRGQDTGAALFYVLDKTSTNVNYFTYAICRARLNKKNKVVEPIKINEGDTLIYLVPTISGHRFIGEVEFLQLRKNYLDKVLIRNLVANRNDNIKDIKNYPTNCFYSDSVLYQFHYDNIENTPLDNIFISILNGATHKNSPDLTGLMVQTPILIIEIDGDPQSSDECVIVGKPYKNKALDVGTLCPPECD